jgi:hypothetical protein
MLKLNYENETAKEVTELTGMPYSLVLQFMMHCLKESISRNLKYFDRSLPQFKDVYFGQLPDLDAPDYREKKKHSLSQTIMTWDTAPLYSEDAFILFVAPTSDVDNTVYLLMVSEQKQIVCIARVYQGNGRYKYTTFTHDGSFVASCDTSIGQLQWPEEYSQATAQELRVPNIKNFFI